MWPTPLEFRLKGDTVTSFGVTECVMEGEVDEPPPDTTAVLTG